MLFLAYEKFSLKRETVKGGQVESCDAKEQLQDAADAGSPGSDSEEPAHPGSYVVFLNLSSLDIRLVWIFKKIIQGSGTLYKFNTCDWINVNGVYLVE